MVSVAGYARLMKQAVTTRLAVTLACSGLLSQESSNEYTFRSNAELVLVNVTVRDKSGNPVHDLKREDFTVMEDSKPPAGGLIRS